MQREYVLEKSSVNKLNAAKVKKQLLTIKKEAEANKTLNVNAKVSGRIKPELFTGDSGAQNYRYSVKLTLSKDGARAEEGIDLVEKIVRKAATLQKWNVVGEMATVQAMRDEAKARPPWMLPQMTEEVIAENFPGIFDRESHLRTIHDATELFVESKGSIRNHTILYGLPAACKTEMFIALKNLYEKDSEVERVHILEKSSATKAGLENYFLDKAEAGELPEIICIEEIEKFDLNVLLPLASIMDGRGTIQKLNARVNRKEKINIIIWATCNDPEYLEKFYRGFIWSRFSQKIECCRPTREQMQNLILPAHIAKIQGGNLAWAKLACDFAYDVLKTDDPREICAVLAGRNRLVDGSYQRDRIHIIESAKIAKERTMKLHNSSNVSS